MTIHSLKPNWGVNYDVGYIGFTSRTDDLVAAGIAWFERFESQRDLPTVEHVLIVSGPDECIEAHARTGVQKAPLSKYFTDPHCRIFFRKPRRWDQILGEDIVISAQRRIGDGYGYGVIAADLLANTYLGHMANVFLRNWPNRVISKLLKRPGSEVCSELAAEVLQANMPHIGCLAQPARMITPQRLFDDTVIFAPWKNEAPVTTLHA